MLAAFRSGFARIGAAVLFLHDATDLPIDSTRLCQALQWRVGLYTSVVATLLSWASLRLYAFPRYVVGSALLDTSHLAEIFAQVMGTEALVAAYLTYVGPLVALVGLHYYWFGLLISKATSQLMLRQKVE